MSYTRSEPDTAPKRSWPYLIGVIPLFLLSLFLHPPEGGVAGRESSYLMGHFTGVSAWLGIAVLVVYGIMNIARKGKGAPRVPIVAFWTLLGLTSLDIASRAGGGESASSTALTADERHGLLIQEDSIRHATLGFAMPSPGAGFVPSPQLQAKLDSGFAGHPDMAGWIVVNAERRATLMIQVTAFAFLDEGRFREFSAGLRKGVSKGEGAVMLEDTVTWKSARGNYTMQAKLRPGVLVKVRCVSGDRARGAFIVCVQTGSADSTNLDLVRNGLRIRR